MQYDQHLCFRCLDSIILILAKSKISKTLATVVSVAEQASLQSQPLKTGFLTLLLIHVYSSIFHSLQLQSQGFELKHDKTNKMICVPSKDLGQPGHAPGLIRVFAVCMKKHWDLGYPLSAQLRLWSVWADAQSPSLGTHVIVFVLSHYCSF